MSPRTRGGPRDMPAPVVHLELHTGDVRGARGFYAGLCDWRSERVETPHGAYHALDVGWGLGGGIVQCPALRPVWLPYVQVDEVAAATERARRLGAPGLLAPRAGAAGRGRGGGPPAPREGAAGWRSVVATPAAGEIALWQPRR